MPNMWGWLGIFPFRPPLDLKWNSPEDIHAYCTAFTFSQLQSVLWLLLLQLQGVFQLFMVINQYLYISPPPQSLKLQSAKEADSF